MWVALGPATTSTGSISMWVGRRSGEQRLAGAEQDGRDVEDQLVELAGGEDLAEEVRAARHVDVAVATRRLRLLQRGGDVGDERERRLDPLERRPGPVGHDEDGRPERRPVAPVELAGVEHRAAHDVGAGPIELGGDEVGLRALLAAVHPEAIAEGAGVVDPAP